MGKIVGTTEAAFLLNISVSRVKVLLKQGRIKGGRKEGRVWKIPLIKGLPQVKERGRGLKGTWRRKRCQKSTMIHYSRVPKGLSFEVSSKACTPRLRLPSALWEKGAL